MVKDQHTACHHRVIDHHELADLHSQAGVRVDRPAHPELIARSQQTDEIVDWVVSGNEY